MKKKSIKKGKIIVIDGIDGSGKKTQTEILFKKLKGMKIPVVKLDFPQYQNNFFGKTLREFLDEPVYNFLKAHAKLASIYYAADRWESSQKLQKYLDEGKIVLLDRYVSSNQIHQGGKIQDLEERKKFIKWLHEMEHKTFKIPKPDVVFYLSLNFETALNLAKLRGGADLSDKDEEYQKNSRESALWLAENYSHVKIIDCDDGKGGIKSREEISEMIFDKVKKYL